jgi:hypothetical protein
MASVHTFDAFDWRQICNSLEVHSRRLAMSSLHCTQLFSQSIEDAMRLLPLDSIAEAIEIAREFEYETSGEVAEIVRWISDNSSCRFGVQWKKCIDSCDKPCGIQRKRQ